MDWLGQIPFNSLVGGGSALLVIAGAIFYLIRFQQSFTDRLEKKTAQDEDTIRKLGEGLDTERRLRRSAEDRYAQLVYLCHTHGVEIPEHLQITPEGTQP